MDWINYLMLAGGLAIFASMIVWNIVIKGHRKRILAEVDEHGNGLADAISNDTNPVEDVVYIDIEGNAAGWPSMGTFRTRTWIDVPSVRPASNNLPHVVINQNRQIEREVEEEEFVPRYMEEIIPMVLVDEVIDEIIKIENDVGDRS